jgi:restriction system protein
MAIWLVRAGRNGEREDFALENGVAVIGWNELGDLSGVKSRDDVKALLQKVYPQFGKAKVNNNAGQIWAFRATIEKGNLVILPLKTRGTIAVGKVIGDYEYTAKNPEGAKHTRKVEWLRDDIPRASFTKKLLHSLGAFMTVCRIQRDNAEAQVLAGLKGKAPAISTPSEVEEIDDASAPLDLEDQAKNSIYEHITENFSGHHLADIVEAILEAQGFECLKSEPGPDGGVDILAGHGKMGFERPRVCVQVKSSQTPVDVKVLRELIGTMKNFSADSGLLVAWGGFKKSVIDEARRGFFEVRLWTAERLIEAIQTHYSEFPDDLKAELRLKRVWTVVPEGKWAGE